MNKNYFMVFMLIIPFFFATGENQNKNITEQRPNILLITADDMNYNAVGAFNSLVPGTTPNIDKLAKEGIRFTNAHVTHAVCQPSRGAIMTGMYGHVSGIEGFNHYTGNKSTLTEYLRSAGYLTGVIGKVNHSLPKFDTELEKFDLIKRGLTKDNELGFGRDPEKYYEFAKSFFLMAKEKDKPFFFMTNSHDPHRPFSGSDDEKRKFGDATTNGVIPAPSKIFSPEEIIVPGFLPDLPLIRKEIAQYYSSVRRCDDTIGKILQALKESGLEENTLIVFISDNGMAFPFAKTNCYLNSTKTPFIAKWPGVIKQSVDTVDFISGIDFLPTFLDAAGVPVPDDINGTSFLPLLKGEKQEGRDVVFTQFHETSAKKRYPMRAVQSKHFGYIFNPWSMDSVKFRNESMAGLTFKAMLEAASNNEKINNRVNLFLYRVVEEFYDFKNDPNALNNLIDDKSYSDEINKMRKEMKNWMEKTNDPAISDFEKYVINY